MSAIAFRLPYDPAFAGRNARRNVSASVGLAKSRRRARARIGDAATSLTPPDMSTRDLAVYVGAPSLGGALVGGLIGGLPGALIVMILAGGGGYIFLRNQKESTATDLCAKDLPEPNRGIALTAIAGTDVAKLTSLSTQSDARGWHCAATEMRARITTLTPVITKAPGPTAPGVESPHKKKLGGTADVATETASAPISPGIVTLADIDALPETSYPWAPYGLRTFAREILSNTSKWPHDKTGWLGTGTNGPAFLFGKLKELGYQKAADQVIHTYLVEIGDPPPGDPGYLGWKAASGS